MIGAVAMTVPVTSTTGVSVLWSHLVVAIADVSRDASAGRLAPL